MERRERVIMNWNFRKYKVEGDGDVCNRCVWVGSLENLPSQKLKVENTSGKLPEGRATMNCESVYGLEFWEL